MQTDLEFRPRTTIDSNGSRWFGQAPATVDELLAVLAAEPLERSFEIYGNFITSDDGETRLWGNFRADQRPDLVTAGRGGALDHRGGGRGEAGGMHVDGRGVVLHGGVSVAAALARRRRGRVAVRAGRERSGDRLRDLRRQQASTRECLRSCRILRNDIRAEYGAGSHPRRRVQGRAARARPLPSLPPHGHPDRGQARPAAVIRRCTRAENMRPVRGVW